LRSEARGDTEGTYLERWVTQAAGRARSIWLATVARKFQVTMTPCPSLEAHKEAVRRSRQLWWLNHETDANWYEVMNEMMKWIAVNEVHLEPAAVNALKKIHCGRASTGHHRPAGSSHRYGRLQGGDGRVGHGSSCQPVSYACCQDRLKTNWNRRPC
jgi:hypothetical protein